MCSSDLSAHLTWTSQAFSAQTTNDAAWRARTPWGDPDLRGEWTTEGEYGVPLERPAQYSTRQFLTDEEYAKRIQDVRVLRHHLRALPLQHFADQFDARRLRRAQPERDAAVAVHVGRSHRGRRALRTGAGNEDDDGGCGSRQAEARQG